VPAVAASARPVNATAIAEARFLQSLGRGGALTDTQVDLYSGDGRSTIEPFVFHVPAIRRVMAALPDYFAQLGITPHTAPDSILLTMQRAAWQPVSNTAADRQAWMRAHYDLTVPRTRATGLLYGYPRSAVEAYIEGFGKVVRGESPPDSGAGGRALMMNIPSYRGDQTWYRKAAPEDSAEDKALRARAAAILSDYKTRRDTFIGPGKPGIVALLRDWFCNANGCAPPAVDR
jgi:hypothetical protein